MNPIKVLLVDDHKLFREGIKSLLDLRDDIQVIGEANNGKEAILKARHYKPDMILMDIRMPVMDGVDAIKMIKSEMSCIQIVVLTVSDEDSDLFGAIKAGAQGYILKNTSSDDLVRQLKAVMEGESALSGAMATKILAEFNNFLLISENQGKVEQEEALTDREIGVLQLIGKGYTNKEIATDLYITESTVKKHVRNILDKLHLRNRVEVALYAKNIDIVKGKTRL